MTEVEDLVPNIEGVSESFWARLQQLRLQGSLCDVQFAVSENETIAAHKLVLLASSQYFSQMYDETGELLDIYHFDGISAESLQMVVDYMYRQLDWNQLTSVPDAMSAAATLQLVQRDNTEQYPDGNQHDSQQYMITMADGQVVVVDPIGKQGRKKGRRGRSMRLVNAGVQTDSMKDETFDIEVPVVTDSSYQVEELGITPSTQEMHTNLVQPNGSHSENVTDTSMPLTTDNLPQGDNTCDQVEIEKGSDGMEGVQEQNLDEVKEGTDSKNTVTGDPDISNVKMSSIIRRPQRDLHVEIICKTEETDTSELEQKGVIYKKIPDKYETAPIRRRGRPKKAKSEEMESLPCEKEIPKGSESIVAQNKDMKPKVKFVLEERISQASQVAASPRRSGRARKVSTWLKDMEVKVNIKVENPSDDYEPKNNQTISDYTNAKPGEECNTVRESNEMDITEPDLNTNYDSSADQETKGDSDVPNSSNEINEMETDSNTDNDSACQKEKDSNASNKSNEMDITETDSNMDNSAGQEAEDPNGANTKETNLDLADQNNSEAADIDITPDKPAMEKVDISNADLIPESNIESAATDGVKENMPVSNNEGDESQENNKSLTKKKKTFLCSVCHQVFKAYGALINHERKSHKLTRKYECETCKVEFETNFKWSLHMRKVHNLKQHTCDECGKQFKSQEGRKQHMDKQHGYGSPRHVCDFCGKQFFMASALSQHIIFNHSDAKPHECGLCERAFKSKQLLNRHTNTFHSNVRNFACDVCGHQFKTKTDMNRHREKHFRSDKPLDTQHKAPRQTPEDTTCQYCGKRFEKRVSRMVHENLQHRQKSEKVSYRCSLCEKTFAIKHYLMMHLKQAHTPKRFQCTGCLQTFGRAPELRKHCNTQGRCKGYNPIPKPFQCPTCHMGFTMKGNLTKHLQHPGRCRANSNFCSDYIVVVEPHDVNVPSTSEQEEVRGHDVYTDEHGNILVYQDDNAGPLPEGSDLVIVQDGETNFDGENVVVLDEKVSGDIQRQIAALQAENSTGNSGEDGVMVIQKDGRTYFAKDLMTESGEVFQLDPSAVSADTVEEIDGQIINVTESGAQEIVYQPQESDQQQLRQFQNYQISNPDGQHIQITEVDGTVQSDGIVMQEHAGELVTEEHLQIEILPPEMTVSQEDVSQSEVVTEEMETSAEIPQSSSEVVRLTFPADMLLQAADMAVSSILPVTTNNQQSEVFEPQQEAPDSTNEHLQTTAEQELLQLQ